MKKNRIFTVVTVALVIGASIFYACQKEDNLLSNDSNFSLQKHQKWNLDDDSYLILKEADAPFQYAIYNEDFEELLNYTHTVLKSYNQEGKMGYCILSSNNPNNLIYYGFITETSSYYNNLDIFINNPDNPFINIDDIDENDENDLCYGKIETSYEKRFDRWLDRQMEKGNDIIIEYDDATGMWKGTSSKPDKWKDPFQN